MVLIRSLTQTNVDDKSRRFLEKLEAIGIRSCDQLIQSKDLNQLAENAKIPLDVSRLE